MWSGGPLSADDTVQIDDAFVRAASDHRRWEIGNRDLTYTLGVTADGVVEVISLARTGGESLIEPTASDADFAYDDERVPLGGRQFRFLGARSAVSGGRVELTLDFALRGRDVAVERHYAVAPGAAVVEMWTTVEAGEAIRLRDLGGLNLHLRARDAWWHRGHDVPDAEGGPFTRQAARLDDGRHVEFGSAALSSVGALPWFGLVDDRAQVVTGLAWSGSWRATLDGTPRGTQVQIALPDMSVAVAAGADVEYPHAFVAVTSTGAGDAAEAIGAWLLNRRGRPFPALATYNTWFTFGIEIDDALIRRQMDSFAAIGGELFQLDAGWYPPTGARNHFDFSAGLGSWQVDRARFPGGLGSLSDYAHQLGMKFGVWVEPERVDMATVGRPGLAERKFLAQADGAYQPGRANDAAEAGQICLAEDEGWRWVRDRLFAFLDEARPDYVKIDLNGWLICNRTDHAHGSEGGNFGHVTGFYRLLDALHGRYPGLLIENVSGGARRLDMELLTRADVAWMDDRSAPAARVRHHLEQLTRVVPPAALLSYLMPHEAEPMIDAADLPLLSRSRMPGILGLAVDFRGMGEGGHHLFGAQIDQFKGLRAVRGQGFSALLTDAVRVDGGGPGWDVLQQINPQSGVAVVFAWRNAHGDRRVKVLLQHLRPEVMYRLRSLDRGDLGRALGEDLMAGGLDIEASSLSASQVFILEPL